MTQTSPSERLTSRQRRIEEQRRKIDAVRSQERRKRLMWVGAAAVVALALFAAFMLLYKPPTPALGHQVPIEGNRNHVPQGSNIPYHNRPPSSSDHYDQPAGYGFFPANREIPTGNWVHDLEHGGIVVLYRPDLCDE